MNLVYLMLAVSCHIYLSDILIWVVRAEILASTLLLNTPNLYYIARWWDVVICGEGRERGGGWARGD